MNPEQENLFTGIKKKAVNARELRQLVAGKNFYEADSHIPGARFMPIDLDRFIHEYNGTGITFDVDVYSHVAYIEAINHPEKTNKPHE